MSFFVASGLALAAIFFIGFIVSYLPGRHHWLVARATAFLALLVSIGYPLIEWLITGQTPALIPVLMGLLVALLGWVIIGYSSRYLEGESRERMFVHAILFTIACVFTLISTTHLLILAVAWTGTSISLHYLLTFYRERKAAQVVAHKKFIVSRLGEIALGVALILIYLELDTLSINTIAASLSAMNELTLPLQFAAVLFALAAVLKTAQLPLHGWIIQVMEAPTPVSALMHAGVVNIGGYVLITMATLINMSIPAQLLLVVVGSITAVLAGWVMMTRISIKVRLAWSTCAQMGFMLMEIGLGLYELAFLHLIAHSIYKGHAFLAAGDAVKQAEHKDYLPSWAEPKGIIMSLLVATALIIASLMIWQWLLPTFSLASEIIVILAFALAPLLWYQKSFSLQLFMLGILRVLGVANLYYVWHLIFSQVLPSAASDNLPQLIWITFSFGLLYFAQIAVIKYSDSRLLRVCFPWIYNGFYLDETFTRLTFKIWPLKLSPVQAETKVNRRINSSGESA